MNSNNDVGGCIRRLDESVVNRIAAGEVIQKPVNALKELLENAIDANSTSIKVIVDSGGLKRLTIIDNGKGIAPIDFPLVCERFATSKLQKVSDLDNIQSFGFRGEALASISYVALVTVRSRTSATNVAYEAQFRDGKMITTPPKACAGLQGTTIIVEDLFYNLAVRRQATGRRASESYAAILSVVSRYAIQYGVQQIAFSCKKTRDTKTDVTTRVPVKSARDSIRTIFGNRIAKELVELSVVNSITTDDANSKVSFTANGYISNANFNIKKSEFICFINNRLVDVPALRKSIEALYQVNLPKHTYPFVYISLEIPGTQIDVNVHPTKRQVKFLHEDRIISTIVSKIEELLQSSNASRTFMAQTTITEASSSPAVVAEKENIIGSSSTSTNNNIRQKALVQKVKKVLPQNLVRTDHKALSMDRFVYGGGNGSSSSSSIRQPIMMSTTTTTSTTNLASVQGLLSQVSSSCSNTLTSVFKEHTFVGIVNDEFCLIQHETKLYLLRYERVLQEYFYQQVLRYFENFAPIMLEGDDDDHDCSVSELMIMALDNPSSGWAPEDGAKDALGEEVAGLFQAKAPMLKEYFGLEIKDSKIVSIPQLCTVGVEYQPAMEFLPEFVLEMATEVEWEDETQCFHDIATAFGNWYSRHIPFKSDRSLNNNDESSTTNDDYKRFLQHTFPNILRQVSNGSFEPSTNLKDSKQIMEVACLKRLYRVFERC